MNRYGGRTSLNVRWSQLLGNVGVRTFFVLSGFLITTLLAREYAKHRRISLRDFYMRRSLRIFPAFYTYLLVVGVLGLLGAVALGDGDLLAAATYTMNFHPDREWGTGHLWSLAVEEQFYLLWPFALVVLGLVKGRMFAIAAIVLAPIVRLAMWYALPEDRALVDQAFPCVFDALATGCVLALARDELAARCRRLFDARWFWCVPLLLVGSLAITRPWIQHGIAMTCANVGIALVVLRCVTRPETPAGRVLEIPLLAWIGTLSYSLYLWQQLFVDRHSHAWINAFPQNVAFAFAAAVACHYLVERPLLRLSARWRDRPVRQVEAPRLLTSELVIELPPRLPSVTSAGAVSVATELPPDESYS